MIVIEENSCFTSRGRVLVKCLNRIKEMFSVDDETLKRCTTIIITKASKYRKRAVYNTLIYDAKECGATDLVTYLIGNGHVAFFPNVNDEEYGDKIPEVFADEFMGVISRSDYVDIKHPEIVLTSEAQAKLLEVVTECSEKFSDTAETILKKIAVGLRNMSIEELQKIVKNIDSYRSIRDLQVFIKREEDRREFEDACVLYERMKYLTEFISCIKGINIPRNRFDEQKCVKSFLMKLQVALDRQKNKQLQNNYDKLLKNAENELGVLERWFNGISEFIAECADALAEIIARIIAAAAKEWQ